MGGQNYYKAEGGFSQYLYQHVGEAFEMNGLRVKIVEKIGTKDHHEGLPLYSNTSDVYLKIARGSTTGEIEQARIMKDRHAFMDLDWGHQHIKGSKFVKGKVHVHFYELKNGTYVKNEKKSRFMNNKEMKLYGSIIHKVAPQAKFR